MNELLNGTIEFNRRLTPEERKDLLCGVSDLNRECVTLDYIDLCESYNILGEVTEWLTSHENGVKEGCFTNCYGDYDGSYRYESGQWRFHSVDSICGFGDNELLDELKYRGYDVSGIKDKSEVKHGKWAERTEKTIHLYPGISTVPVTITIRVPNDRDAKEYIDEYLDGLLSDFVRFNCEWEFA